MLLFFAIPGEIKTLLIMLVTGLVLVGVMLRPWKITEALIALAGAGLLLLLGLITPQAAFFQLVQDWSTFFFFLGMMGISALAERAGFFDWLAGVLGACLTQMPMEMLAPLASPSFNVLRVTARKRVDTV